MGFLLHYLSAVILVLYLLLVLLPLLLQLMHLLFVLLAESFQIQLKTGDGELQLPFYGQ